MDNSLIDMLKAQNIDSSTADAILEQGVDFPVIVDNPSFGLRIATKLRAKLKLKLGFLPSSKQVFMIYPIKLGTMFEISKLLNLIDINPILKIQGIGTENLDLSQAFNTAVNLIETHKDNILLVACYAIYNKPGKPSKRLYKFLDANLDCGDLYKLFQVVITQSKALDFLAGTVSIKGLNLFQSETGKGSPEKPKMKPETKTKVSENQKKESTTGE